MSKKNSVGQSPLLYDGKANIIKRLLLVAGASALIGSVGSLFGSKNSEKNIKPVKLDSPESISSRVTVTPKTEDISQKIFRGYDNIYDVICFHSDGGKVAKMMYDWYGNLSQIINYRNDGSEKIDFYIPESNGQSVSSQEINYGDSHFRKTQTWYNTNGFKDVEVTYNDDYTLKSILRYDASNHPSVRSDYKDGKVVAVTKIDNGVEVPVQLNSTNDGSKEEKKNISIINRLNLKSDGHNQILYNSDGYICGFVNCNGNDYTITDIGKNGEITKVTEVKGNIEKIYNYAGKVGQEGIASTIVVEYDSDGFVKHSEFLGTDQKPITAVDYDKRDYKLSYYDNFGNVVKSESFSYVSQSDSIVSTDEIDGSLSYKSIYGNDGSITKIKFNKSGAKESEYTLKDGIEKGVIFVGNTGEEQVHSTWVIEYYPDGVTYKSQKWFTADGTPIRYTSYDEKGNVVSREELYDVQLGIYKEELCGAQLGVYKEDGTLVDSWVSGKKPHSIKGLEEGKYYLKEIIAPDGYKPSEETIEFEVDEMGNVISEAFDEKGNYVGKIIANPHTNHDSINKIRKIGGK